ncbi:MAG: polysaccharide deacetylase family protein [Spirochaetaceae bacterium]|nr:polysaccharide deacetylase family protein [Spirochaetaceae bacterium]MCF7948397.1 polysaccharide deacetylase family protein [Spirochaetia bacterium]MCF7950846.1 polysaccharide deacetylase family protein [Spirochaetaceae bacterium]
MKPLIASVIIVLLFGFSPAPGWSEDKTSWTTDEAYKAAEAGVAGTGDGQFTLGLLAPLGEIAETGATGATGEAKAAGQAADIPKFALRRIAEIQGLPYRFIQSPREMNHYPLIIMASAPSNAQLDAGWREALYNYVEDGGVLFVPGKAGSELYPLLGIGSIDSNKHRARLEFSDEYIGREPAFAYIDHPREREISLGNGAEEVHSEVIWSHGAQPAGMAEVLARFEDGSAGMLRNYYGRGIAYHFGLSLAETVLLPQTGGDYEAQRSFVNTVEPSADVVMLLLKGLYEAILPQAVYLSPIPQARPTALLLSHDVDAQTSFADSLKFAALAQEFGARSTFFIHTKYYENWMDIAYYNLPKNKQALRRVSQQGHELGSHTVAHALEFDKAPPGSPQVRFESYTPQKHITINGEVRVSKQLLDQDIAGQNTVSFRAGYLAFPPELISILEAAGYKYDSSFSANDVLTTFPYFALPQRQPGAEESGIIEIPVTFDDALGYLTPENRQAAVRQWKQVVKAHAANETISVLLIHPSDTRTHTYKLQAQRELMEYARSLDAWMGSIREFGDFWRARHWLQITKVRTTTGTTTGTGPDTNSGGASGEAGLIIHLSQPSDQLHPWTGLVLPGAVRYKNVQILDSEGKNIAFTSRTARGKMYLSLQP